MLTIRLVGEVYFHQRMNFPYSTLRYVILSLDHKYNYSWQPNSWNRFPGSVSACLRDNPLCANIINTTMATTTIAPLVVTATPTISPPPTVAITAFAEVSPPWLALVFVYLR